MADSKAGSPHARSKKVVIETEESLYRKAMARKNADIYIVQYEFRMNNYLAAAEMFEQVGDYLDAPELARKCRQKAQQAAEDWKKSDYRKALLSMDQAQTREDWEKAQKALEAMGDYADAPAKAAQCQRKVQEFARKNRHKRNRILVILAALVALIAAGFPAGFWKYMLAWGYMKAGSYSNAQTAFGQTDFYNAAQMAMKNEYLRLEEAGEGDILTFGGYRWKVLRTDPEQTLLILNVMTDDYNLSGRAFHSQQTSVTWKDSSLRQFLNGEFLQIFSEQERESLAVQTVAEAENIRYGTWYESSTQDYVTILSASEAVKYKDLLSNYTSDFWLRTPGSAMDTACLYSAGTGVLYFGDAVTDDTITCRPVILVNRQQLADQSG